MPGLTQGGVMQVRAEGLRAEIVHNWTGRFFAVLHRGEGKLVVQELCRRAWGKGYQSRVGNLNLGYIVPNRQAFLPGSQPFLTTVVAFVPWRGGRLRAVWSDGAVVETCPAHELGIFSIPTQYVGLANAVMLLEAGPGKMAQGVGA